MSAGASLTIVSPYVGCGLLCAGRQEYDSIVTDERLTQTELAEQSGSSDELVGRLVELGIVARREDERPFTTTDIHRVRLAQALDESGISLETIGSAVASGHLSFDFVGTMFPEPPALTGRTFREVAAGLGVPLDMVTRAYPMWGLPRPDPDDVVREDDEAVFSQWLAVLPPEMLNEQVLVHGARMLGEHMHRVADWAMDLLRTYLEAPARASGMASQQVMEAASAFAPVGTRLLEHQMSWLLRRQLEHNTTQYVIEYVEAAVEAAGVAPPRPARPPAIAFLDLTGYTTLTEELGDEVAAERAAMLASTVQEISQAHRGHVVKLLGDGAMIHLPDPGTAVPCGLELIEGVEKAGLPPARVGVAAGPVVIRDGDYFGRTVNVAARVADYARPGEVLATTDVVAASNPDEVSFAEVSSPSLKGVAGPVSLSRASWVR
jgi:adenylate cyclase